MMPVPLGVQLVRTGRRSDEDVAVAVGRRPCDKRDRGRRQGGGDRWGERRGQETAAVGRRFYRCATRLVSVAHSCFYHPADRNTSHYGVAGMHELDWSLHVAVVPARGTRRRRCTSMPSRMRSGVAVVPGYSWIMCTSPGQRHVLVPGSLMADSREGLGSARCGRVLDLGLPGRDASVRLDPLASYATWKSPGIREDERDVLGV